MKRICITILLFLLLVKTACMAQDAHMSQFYASPVSINPATTGMYDGNYKIFFQHRTQWRAALNDPYVTENIAFDKPTNKRYKYGALLSNTKAGMGGFNTMNVLLSGSYEITIDPSGIHNLTTGLQLGIVYKHLNINDLTFENQYTTLSGGGFDKNIASGETFTTSSIVTPKANAGVYYYYNDVSSKFKPYCGIAGFNLNAPKESFMGQTVRTPMRFLMNAGVKYQINEIVSVHPMMLYMRQAKVNEFNPGFLVHYFMKESNVYVYGGPYYRWKDAISMHFGLIYRDYTLGFSYDINNSVLNAVTNGRGAFEVSLLYTRQKSKFVPSF